MRISIFLSLLLTIITLPAISQTEKTSLKLVWSDEFNGKGLPDSSKWNYDIGGHGWGNNELQYYTKSRSKNARMENGNLIIEAHKEEYEGKKYTSARLVSKGKGDWKYGKIEVRARIPQGVGTWPAIWMLASTTPLKWPDDGEIDVMEHVGWNPHYVHASVHTKKFNHTISTQRTDTVIINDVFKQYHVYGVEWDGEKVQVSVDGIIYFNFKNDKSGYEAWPFDNKMHLLLNIAVGGNWGGVKGVDETIWPRRMEIDWVRVYQ
ncbi:MAG: glycoside hydrolase family 16 protein [Chitinophagaceae bacterium]|nr:glycoside hydrolase family 16 protein [Chitinophagaceae bacterium]